MTTSHRAADPPGSTGATNQVGNVTALRRDGTMIELDAATVEAFAADLAGDLLGPGDAGYDQARRVWNGMIDRHPALIARCASTDDVARTVDFARTHDIVMSVR